LLINTGIILNSEKFEEVSSETLETRIKECNASLNKVGYKPSKFWGTQVNLILDNKQA